MSGSDEAVFVSVIVPVYNETDHLPKLLSSLVQLDYDPERFEILFADNGSTDDSRDLIGAFIDRYPGYGRLYVEDRKIGSYAARNRALEEARGNLVVFTDADCCVSKGWLQEIERELCARGRHVVIGGRVELVPERERKPNAVEMYEMLLGFSQHTNVSRSGYSVTANLATWKDNFIEVGPFAELKSKGDYEWCRRASEKGIRIEYADNVIVYHPARRNLGDLITKSRRVTGGQYDLAKRPEINQNRVKRRSWGELFIAVLQNQQFPAWRQKMSVLAVAGLVVGVKSYEIIRLKLGFLSERR